MLAALASGCYTGRLRDVEHRLDNQQHMLDYMERQNQETVARAGDEVVKLWKQLSCKNERLKTLLADCKQHASNGQCMQKTMEHLMSTMSKEPHVLVRLRPDTGVASLSSYRLVQLKELLAPSKINGASTVLTIALPPDDRQYPETEQIARNLRRHIIAKTSLKEDLFLPPTTITCKGKQVVLASYKGIPDDSRRIEEPKEKEPQVTLWVFHVEC